MSFDLFCDKRKCRILTKKFLTKSLYVYLESVIKTNSSTIIITMMKHLKKPSSSDYVHFIAKSDFYKFSCILNIRPY